MCRDVFIDMFDDNGNTSGVSIQLNEADPLFFEAENLFGIDLNDDDIQGRNVKEFDRDAFINQKNLYLNILYKISSL